VPSIPPPTDWRLFTNRKSIAFPQACHSDFLNERIPFHAPEGRQPHSHSIAEKTGNLPDVVDEHITCPGLVPDDPGFTAQDFMINRAYQPARQSSVPAKSTRS
jgi:hypothetical protein